MKKTIFIFAMMLATVVSFAQQERPIEGPKGQEKCNCEELQIKSTHVPQTVEHSSFFENMYMNISGGAAMPWLGGISETTGVMGIEFGKNITPIFGVSVEGMGNFSNVYGGTTIDFSNIVGNVKVNLSNAIGGYKGQPRVCEVSLVPGIGWGHIYTNNFFISNYDRNFLTYNASAQVDFNLGKKKQFQINVKPSMMWLAGNNSVAFNANRSAFVCRVGFTYKFGRKGSHNFRLCEHTITQAEYDKVLALYMAECKKPPIVKHEVHEKVVVKETSNVVVPEYHVVFRIGSSEMNSVEKLRLEEYVETLPKDIVVNVIGSADLGTGSKKINEKLATERANKVTNYLKEKGVKVNKVDVEYDATTLPEASRATFVVINGD